MSAAIAYPELNAKRMLRPILQNYNRHVLRFLRLLESLSCELSYEGPPDFHDHVRDKTVYACSLRVRPTVEESMGGCVDEDGPRQRSSKRKMKLLRSVFPVMIGSDLDHCVRKRGLQTVSERDLTSGDHDFLADVESDHGTADIAASFFLINGCVRQLPYFFTNDPTNAHIVRGRSLVRCYTYDADDRGKEMSYFAERDEKGRYERGDVEVVLNDGTTVRNCEQNFFDHCPHGTEQGPYMDKIYRDGRFDIDHLANKVVVSPGHLFLKLFVKYLYRPLKTRDWPTIKSKHAMVVRSIETGTLLHVLSKKTVYFRDPPSTMTVVNPSSGGSGNNDVYVEKNTGCYREVTMQTYPLNPYLSHLITRQISSKVTNDNVIAFHPSYIGFLCLVGSFETKNIGRTGVMVRNTSISLREDVECVYDLLRLDVVEREKQCPDGTENHGGGGGEKCYVVVNEACVPVTRTCFDRICRGDLEKLKKKLRLVECYRSENFVLIRYKIGLIFKKIYCLSYDDEDEKDGVVWVTARDESFWKRHYRGRLRPDSFSQTTSYLTDLSPFFHHNVFTKNILAFNTLKSAILSTNPVYSEYFAETLSAYAPLSPHHRIVCKPVDSFSERFVLRVPLLTVAYASFKGLDQEDCIVVHRDVRAFDCYRFHTVRIKFDTPSRYVSFHPTRGDPPDPECYLLGNLVCHDASLPEFKVSPQTMHARLELLDGCGRCQPHHRCSHGRHYRIYFNKPGFVIRSFELTDSRLVVCFERFHPSQTGDKLSSFHGQKGVLRTVDAMPVFGRVRDAFGNVETTTVHVLVNPYCMFRMTLGQTMEQLFRGGRDHDVLWNSDGKRVETGTVYGIFAGDTFYFGVNYMSDNHIHAPFSCGIDFIINMPFRGRSRDGGMRIGNMETMNGMRGNGLAACYEEKALEHSDRIFHKVRRIVKRAKRRCSGETKIAAMRIESVQKANVGDESKAPECSELSVLKRGKRSFGEVKSGIVSSKRLKMVEGYSAPVPKSCILIKEDLAFYKYEIRYYTKPSYEETTCNATTMEE